MARLNWKRLFWLGGVLLAGALVLRGCRYVGQPPPEQYGEDELGGELAEHQTVLLYIESEQKKKKVDLEEYVAGVVAAEMPASFAGEALKAQAVAARTYTLSRMQNGGCESGAQVCTDSGCCQAYDSVQECQKKWGLQYTANMKKISTAVNSTANEALYYGGTLIDALFHAASGGYTEDSENVFASAQPYLRGVESGNEVGSSHITGEKKWSRKSFVKAVNDAFPKAKLKTASLEKQVEVTHRYESGRVQEIRLGSTTATGRELRGALELDSAWFTVTISADEVAINTKGYGHGVGMSQAGANGMAQEGADYREILAHYYSGTQIALSN